MNGEYYWEHGRNVYLADMNTNECAKFDTFGQCLGNIPASYVYYDTTVHMPVDVISILGDPSSEVTDVYFGRKRYLVGKPPMDVYSDVYSRYGNVVVSALRLNWSDEGVIQVMLPCRQGKVDAESLENLFKNFLIRKRNI